MNAFSLSNPFHLTVVYLVIMLAAFSWFVYLLARTVRCSKQLKAFASSDQLAETLRQSVLQGLMSRYEMSLTHKVKGTVKTTMPANVVFSEGAIVKAFGFNIRLLDIGAGLFVGLGLFGTFLGLTMGIYNFNAVGTEQVLKSIQVLLDGMGTAFVTSLVGMGFSICFSFLDKQVRVFFSLNRQGLTQALDAAYFIDELSLAEYYDQLKMERLRIEKQQFLEEQTAAIAHQLKQCLSYEFGDDERVPIAHAIRDIRIENGEQTKALKSFSLDLASSLGDIMDQALSRQLEAQLVPVFQEIVKKVDSIVDHIDKLGATVSSPAEGLMEKVVAELKQSMSTVLGDLGQQISGSTTHELEEIVQQLAGSVRALGEFPESIHAITSTLDETLGAIRVTMQEQVSHANISSEQATRRLQEQVDLAVQAISGTIQEVNNTVGRLNVSSQQQNDQLVSRLSQAVDRMDDFIEQTISKLTQTVEQTVHSLSMDSEASQRQLLQAQAEQLTNSKEVLEALTQQVKDQMQSMSTNVASQHDQLLSVHRATLSQTSDLISEFLKGVQLLNRVNANLKDTLEEVCNTHDCLEEGSVSIRTASNSLSLASDRFTKSQKEYVQYVDGSRGKYEQSMATMERMVKSANEQATAFIQQHALINEGLHQVFEVIQQGVHDYTETVSASTQRLFTEYTGQLTSALESLAGSVEELREIAELLDQSNQKMNRRV